MVVKPEITAYRPCVGMMLLNREGLVWIGSRYEKQDDEGKGQWWQMPQGGIDSGENPRAAALRELAEETSVKSVKLIAESPRWYNYDLPEHLIGKSWKGRYRGQTQKWFAARFLGDDRQIDVAPPGHKREFGEWRWAPMADIPDLVVPFKRQVYQQVVAAFRHLGQ